MRNQRKKIFSSGAIRENFLEEVTFEKSFEGKAKVRTSKTEKKSILGRGMR